MTNFKRSAELVISKEKFKYAINRKIEMRNLTRKRSGIFKKSPEIIESIVIFNMG
jgi:hypothetical protein